MSLGVRDKDCCKFCENCVKCVWTASWKMWLGSHPKILHAYNTACSQLSSSTATDTSDRQRRWWIEWSLSTQSIFTMLESFFLWNHKAPKLRYSHDVFSYVYPQTLCRVSSTVLFQCKKIKIKINNAGILGWWNNFFKIQDCTKMPPLFYSAQAFALAYLKFFNVLIPMCFFLKI